MEKKLSLPFVPEMLGFWIPKHVIVTSCCDLLVNGGLFPRNIETLQSGKTKLLNK